MMNNELQQAKLLLQNYKYYVKNVEIAELQVELAVKKLDLAKLHIQIIEKALMNLVPEERKMLYATLIDGNTVESASYDLHIERSTAYRRYNNALNKFSNTMFGTGETNGKLESNK